MVNEKMSRSALAPSSYDSLKWTRSVQESNHLGGIILPPIKQWQPQRPTNKLPHGRKMGADLPLLLPPIKKLEKASTRMSHKSAMKFQVHLYQQPSYISLLIKNVLTHLLRNFFLSNSFLWEKRRS